MDHGVYLHFVRAVYGVERAVDLVFDKRVLDDDAEDRAAPAAEVLADCLGQRLRAAAGRVERRQLELRVSDRRLRPHRVLPRRLQPQERHRGERWARRQFEGVAARPNDGADVRTVRGPVDDRVFDQAHRASSRSSALATSAAMSSSAAWVSAATPRIIDACAGSSSTASSPVTLTAISTWSASTATTAASMSRSAICGGAASAIAARSGAVPFSAAARSTSALIPCEIATRSEERRVGKECR